MLSLEEIKAEVDRLAARIGAECHLLPTYGRTDGSGRPHLEVDAENYHLVVSERGTEFERLTTPRLEEVLEKIFHGITSWMASKYEVAHRVETQDPRRISFPKQLELLGQLSPHWMEAQRRRHEGILKEHPLRDDLCPPVRPFTLT